MVKKTTDRSTVAQDHGGESLEPPRMPHYFSTMEPA